MPNKGWVKITKLDSCTGEASVSNRKGKRIVAYELNVTLTWYACVYVRMCVCIRVCMYVDHMLTHLTHAEESTIRYRRALIVEA